MPAAERETRTDPGKRDGAAGRGRRDTGRGGFAAAKSFCVEAPPPRVDSASSMQRSPLAALSVLPVRLGLGRVSFYDQATVIRRVSGLPHGGVDFGAQEGTPILSAT